MIALKQNTTASVEQTSALKRQFVWRLGFLLVLILSAGVYMTALHGLPIWEDERLIHSGEGSLADCFRKPFLGAYFRPLVSVSFWLDHKFWGEEPFMYHQTNILLHVLTTLVLMFLLKDVFRSRRCALVGGLLFAVQPAQVSAVAWIGGRTDSMCTLWVALFAWMLILCARSTGRPRLLYLFAALFWFTLALLTKEQAIALLPLVPLALTCFKPEKEKPSPGFLKLALLSFALLSAAFLFAAYRIGPGLPRTASHGPLYALSLCGRTLTYYVLLLFAPTYRWMHTLTTISLQSLGIWTIVSGYALLAVSLLLFWRCLRTNPPVAWFLALTLLAVLPVSNILPLGSLIVAPFRAGIAGLGVAALLGRLLTVRFDFPAFQARRQTVAILQMAGGTLLLLWSLNLTIWGVGKWDDSLTLYTAFARYDPNSLYVREGMFGTLMEAKKYDLAKKDAESLLTWFFGPQSWQSGEAALAAYQRDPDVLARIHSSNGDKRKPRTAVSDLYTLLGYARDECKDRAGALTAFRAGEMFDSQNGSVSLALGRWFYEDHNWNEAISYFEKVHAANPRIPVAYVLEGNAYGLLKQWKQAGEAYQAAIRLQPWDGTVYLSLANAQEKQGEPGAAISTLQSALAHEVTHDKDIQLRLAVLSSRR